MIGPLNQETKELKAFRRPLPRAQAGRWIRQKAEGVGSILHPRIDSYAQRGLMRMLENPHARADAAALLAAVKSGRLGGIYKEDQKVPALRARNLSRGWWDVIPAHADAALVRDFNDRSAAPILVFRSSLQKDASRLDRALRRAWGVFKSTAKLSPAAGLDGEIAFLPALGAFQAFILPITAALPSVRRLDPAEISVATSVFGKSLDFSRIRVSDALGFGARPFTLAIPPLTVLNLGPGPFSSPASAKALLIHELTHSWQSQHHLDPFAYEANSIACQALAVIRKEDAYCYHPGKKFRSYAAEQIAQSVEYGFLGTGGTHSAAIIAHIASVPASRADGQNMLSLLVPRTEKPGSSGVVC